MERKRRPTHRGYVVQVELDELGMTITKDAERLRVRRQTLSELVNEKRSSFATVTATSPWRTRISQL